MSALHINNLKDAKMSKNAKGGIHEKSTMMMNINDSTAEEEHQCRGLLLPPTMDLKDIKIDKEKDWKQMKELKMEKDTKFNKQKPDKDFKEKETKKEKVIKSVSSVASSSSKVDSKSTFNKNKNVIKSEKKKPRRKIPNRQSWKNYIHKTLKTVHEDDCTLSSKAMGILDSFAHDFFDRIATEAVKLLRLNNKKTLTSMEIQTAARLVLPGDLCKHAIHDGGKAVSKYSFRDTCTI